MAWTTMQHTLSLRSPEPPDGSPNVAALAAGRRVVGRHFSAVASSDIDADSLVALVESPERASNDPAAVVVKRGRSALVVRVTLGACETQVAYKRCGSRTWLRRLARGMRRSAALRNFRLGVELARLGIATPRPLLAVSPRWHNLLQPSFLATQWIEGALPLDAFSRRIGEWTPARRQAALRDAAKQLGHLIGTLHRRGFLHRDLKSANLLARETDRQIEVFLVDLDGATRSGLGAAADRLKNLARLHRATCSLPHVTQTLRCRFLRSYMAAAGRSPDWKTVWRHLAKTSRIPPLRRTG
jgi:tRNA A-37 threonylcarbamoyl transferase component Bud32